MSPKRWGVLDNEATKMLMGGGGSRPDLPVARDNPESGADSAAMREALYLLASYTRQMLTKIDEIAYLTRRNADQLRQWNNDGAPVEILQR